MSGIWIKGGRLAMIHTGPRRLCGGSAAAAATAAAAPPACLLESGICWEHGCGGMGSLPLGYRLSGRVTPVLLLYGPWLAVLLLTTPCIRLISVGLKRRLGNPNPVDRTASLSNALRALVDKAKQCFGHKDHCLTLFLLVTS